MMRKVAFAFCCVFLAQAAHGYPAEQQQQQQAEADYGVDRVLAVVKECSETNVFTCLKMRALQFADRELRKTEDIRVTDGVVLVKSGPVESSRGLNGRSLSESELQSGDEETANEVDKDAAVENLLLDRLARFLESHTLQLKVPESSISDMRRSLEEARGKKKKQQKMLMPLLMMLKMKAIALVPLAIGALALLAFKALVVGKLALVLAVVIGIQKLLANKAHQSYEVVSHPHYTEEHGHHGYGRSLQQQDAAGAAQDMAYRGQH